MTGFIGLILDIFIFIVPIFACYRLCELRHRNPWKGAVVGLLGWLAFIGMWLALKRRNPSTLALY